MGARLQGLDRWAVRRIGGFLDPTSTSALIASCSAMHFHPGWLLPLYLRNLILQWKCTCAVPRSVAMAALVNALDIPEPPEGWPRMEWTMGFHTFEWKILSAALCGEGKLKRDGRAHGIYSSWGPVRRWRAFTMPSIESCRETLTRPAEYLTDHYEQKEIHGLYRMVRLDVNRFRRSAPLAMSLIY